jgi:hypothetical protein
LSRSGYSEDLDNWAIIKWRGAVKSAIRGERGQKFLRELLTALDAMPEKGLIAGDLERDGEYCALGVLGAARGLPLDKIDPEDPPSVAEAFNIARALACEIVFENDEAGHYAWTPGRRWWHMRCWVAGNLIPPVGPELPQ